ncbi:hypothetical protein [Haloplasma contractile]|uniref:Uncharacterized protein n=1 Tax=Haloplasma contractile SSD-17B TaxID=1033810 RepID=U2EDU2_9MOLU|nr:hypothetical protein [Haloplasma contractile]ERJ13158.1 hypothetical protein HLPCO_000777 [Haloplasma contractile SSD-17B]
MINNFNLYLYIIFISMLGIGALIGFMRGYKKSLYSLIVMSIFYIIFFLTIDFVVQGIWDMKIPGLTLLFETINSELVNATSFKQAMPKLLDIILGDTYGASFRNNEEFLTFLSNLSLLLVKIVYTILYFTIISIIYKLIFFIVRLIFFNSKEDQKEPKRRGIGTLLGFIRGSLSVYFTIIILGGVMSISGSISTLLPPDKQVEELDVAVQSYNSNYVIKTVELLSIKDQTLDQNVSLNNVLFDYAYSFKYNGYRIAPRKELTYAAELKNLYLQSDYKDTANISDITGPEIKEGFTILSGSDLFPAALPLGIELAAGEFKGDFNIPEEKLYKVDWETEIEQFGKVATVTFELLNTAGLDQEGASLETVTFEGDQVRELFNELSKSQVITLTAYEVIDPLLENTNGNLQTIITVPEGLDWKKEIQAIGLVAGAVADTNMTLDELKSGDPAFIVSTLSDIDATVILESKIMSHSLVTIFSGDANIEAFDALVVPENINWYDSLDSEGNLTQEGELRRILLAVNELTKISSTLDFDSLDLNLIADLTDESIDILFNSKVMIATLSSLITDLNLGNNTILVVDSVYDEEGFIQKDELTSLAKSVRFVFDHLACEDGNVACEDTGFNLSKAFKLNDSEIDQLFASTIIHATIGNTIVEDGGGILTIPSNSLTSVYVKEIERQIVSKEETKQLFKSASQLGFTDIKTMAFDASIIHNLSTDDDAKVLDDEKTETVLNSAITHATLSTMLLDLTDSTSNVLLVPEQTINGELVRYQDQIEYISKDEITEVLEAVLVLELSDFNDIETLGVSSLSNNLNALLESAIFHATISDQLISLGDDVLLIPESDISGIETKRIVGQTEFIIKDELQNLLDGLNLLGFTSINSFTGDVSLNTLDQDTNQTTLLSSATMHATISKKLLELNDTVLIIPTYLEASDTYIQKDVSGTQFVVKQEIKATINAFIEMGYIDMEHINDVSPNNVLNANYDILLNSVSIQATISDLILDHALDEQTSVGASTLIIPTHFRESIEVNQITEKQVERDELSKLLTSLKLLNITDFEGAMDATLITTMSKSDLDTMLLSASIHATYDNMLKGNSYIDIPELAKQDLIYQNDITEKEEIKNFILAANTLTSGSGTFTTVSFDITSIMNLTETEQDLVLNSMIVRNGLTNEIHSVIDENTLLADHHYENGDRTTFLTKQGIEYVLTNYASAW